MKICEVPILMLKKKEEESWEKKEGGEEDGFDCLVFETIKEEVERERRAVT